MLDPSHPGHGGVPREPIVHADAARLTPKQYRLTGDSTPVQALLRWVPIPIGEDIARSTHAGHPWRVR